MGGAGIGERLGDSVAVEEVGVRGDLGGPATYGLVCDAFRVAAREVPAGLLDRTDSRPLETEDVLQNFLVDKIDVLPDELALCISDRQMTTIVTRTAKNWLIDRARETERGSHRHALEKVLRADEDFVQRPAQPMWALSGNDGDWSGSPDELHAAARAVTALRPGRRGTDTQRPALAPREDLRRVLRAVLSTAAAFVHIEVLTTVVRARVQAWTPITTSLQDLTEQQLRDPALHVVDEKPAEQSSRDAEVATAVLDALDPRERTALLHLDDPIVLQQLLGVGKSQASALRARVRARLESIDTSDADLQRVLALLRTMLTTVDGRSDVSSVRLKFPQAYSAEGGMT